MIDRSLQRTSSAPENCRRSASLSDAGLMNLRLTSRKAPKHVRHNRMELRRLKSKNIASHEHMIRVCPPSMISLTYQSVESLSSSENVVRNVSRIATTNTTQTTRENMEERVTCGSHGKISVIGRRREMEDAVTVELGFVSRSSRKYHFYGVYDGHGGSRVAQACCEQLHRVVVKEIGEEVEEEIDWEKVMTASFRKMDEEVIASGRVTGSIGSTAVVAVVGEEVVVVANCGDSRAVLSRDGVPVPLSTDHKPDRPDELERIEVSGGRVINWNGQRVLGVLSTSRSIGDEYLKPYVIARPDVTVSRRSQKDEFLILASDGLWDVITNELACQVVKRCLGGLLRRRSTSPSHYQGAAISEMTASSTSTTGHGGDQQVDNEIESSRSTEAAAVLAELAMARGSRDNISVIVVVLNR